MAGREREREVVWIFGKKRKNKSWRGMGQGRAGSSFALLPFAFFAFFCYDFFSPANFIGCLSLSLAISFTLSCFSLLDD